MSIFPTSVYFTAVYTESLFFMLTVASFYYMRDAAWWLAGATRLLRRADARRRRPANRAILIEWWAQERPTSRPRRSTISSRGAAHSARPRWYMAYLWVLRADPLYFSHVQIHWNRHFAPPWVSVINAFGKVAHGPGAQLVANQSLEVALHAS